ncbi:MICOS complex subunit mic25-a-like [Brevipalpus obovatus]|uniref:MICOS complex subunit mic25-a-like n=1 Tax=Brevipalpus obovatus TaxID=246614 RepID=UPI003D9EB1B3
MGASQSGRKITIVDNGGSIELSKNVIDRIENNLRSTNDQQQQQQQQSQQQQQQQPRSSPPPQHHQQMPSQYDEIPSHPSVQQPTGTYIPMDMLRLRQQHQEELEMVHHFNDSKVNMLEQQNKILWRAAKERFDKNLTGIEENYTKRQAHEPVCVEAEKLVESCYASNVEMPLKCSKQAKDFINCIDHIRRQVL